jgi:hypothetical protein
LEIGIQKQSRREVIRYHTTMQIKSRIQQC